MLGLPWILRHRVRTRSPSSAFGVLERTIAAFDAVGIHNAVSLLVDRQAVYLDYHDAEDDLAQTRQAAYQSGLLHRSMNEMQLVMSRRGELLMTLIDVRISALVARGTEGMTLAISSCSSCGSSCGGGCGGGCGGD